MPHHDMSWVRLDRTKELGGPGEPLYIDVLTTYAEAFAAGRISPMPVIVGGRYGLSSKDFDPAMAKTVFDELKKPEPKRGFVVRALFFGLGADGTVGANKNSTKILASDPARHAQGYFVYDSKKSGSYTISHLRFGPRPNPRTVPAEVRELRRHPQVRLPLQARHARGRLAGRDGDHQQPYGPDDVWSEIPQETQQQIVDRKLKVHVIDASRVASGLGLGSRSTPSCRPASSHCRA